MFVDDCWHPVRNPYAMEWWYFTLLCDDGAVIRGRLWVKGDAVLGVECGVEVAEYGSPESNPTREGRLVTFILAPKKTN